MRVIPSRWKPPCQEGVLMFWRREDPRVAVEVETGKSDVVGNVKRALEAKVDRVIVVATDETALKVVERRLGEAGLLGIGRVALYYGKS